MIDPPPCFFSQEKRQARAINLESLDNYKNMTKKQAVQKEAVDTLKQWGLVDGATVYAKVNKVSASGMSRNVGLYVVRSSERINQDRSTLECELLDISYHAARALEWPYKDGYNGGVRVSGCGMDMLLHTVASLSYAMGYGSLDQSYGEPIKNSTGHKGLRYRSL